MGISIPLVVYTHTDMKDVWPMFFGQLKRYIGDTKVYVAVNEYDMQLSDYIRIIYDDSKPYTDRWVEILHHIEEELLLFMHEDMILFDSPKFDLIEKYSYKHIELSSNLIELQSLKFASLINEESDFDLFIIFTDKLKEFGTKK